MAAGGRGQRSATPAASQDAGQAEGRRRTTATIKQSLRELSIQLSLLNHQVGARLKLKDIDLQCLDLVDRHGPLGPSALARLAGLHPATVTGILDRLQRGGWITRERDPGAADRRAVTVRAVRDRNSELVRLYSSLSGSVEDICADYSDAELETLVDFLRRVTGAGQEATERLAGA